MISNHSKKVIIIAYACTPGANSEHGLGWQWVDKTAEKYKVILVTRPGREGLAEQCRAKGIALCEVPVPRLCRKWTQKFGDVGIWLRVYAWASSVRQKVRELTKNEEISYAHLVTFHSIWMPDVIGDVNCIKVWGPASGGEYVPNEYLSLLGPEKKKERLRNTLNKWIHNKIIQRSINYDVMLYGNTQTQRLIESERAGVNRVVMPNTIAEGADNEKKVVKKRWQPGEVFNLAFVGSCQGRRGMSVLIEALSKSNKLDWNLDIAGTGPALEYWKSTAKTLGVQEKIKFHGWVGKEVVNDIYQNAHLFAFPTLRDGGGSGMLEAIERGVPVLALDWGGPADVIGMSGAGVLFEVLEPQQTVNKIANWLEDLSRGEVDYDCMAISTVKYDFKPFKWESKIRLLGSALEDRNTQLNTHKLNK